MSNIILIIISFFSGTLLKRLKIVPDNAHQTLNTFIIYLSLPALTLYYVPQIKFEWSIIYPFLMPWIVLVFSIGFFQSLSKFFKWDRATLGALVLVCGLGNISFVGYPVIEAIYKETGLEIAILVGQGGFLAVSVMGVFLAMHYASTSGSWKEIGWNVIKFPPFIAFALGLALGLFGNPIPISLMESFKALGSTLTPLAMASVGLQFRLNLKDTKLATPLVGLGYKLIFAPIGIWLLYQWLIPNDMLMLKVAVVEAGMPPMVTAAIIASQYKLNSPLANLLVGLGLVISAGSLLAWWVFLG